MKKILHLRNSGNILGAENVIIEIANNSKQYGYISIIGAIKDKNDIIPEFITKARLYGIETIIFENNGKIDSSAIKKIRHYIFNQNIDLIHCHGYKSDFYGFFSAKNIPKIATNHLWKGNDFKSKFYFFIDKWILKYFNHVVAVSNEIQNDMIRKYINNTSVVHNGVDTNIFIPRSKNNNLLAEFGVKTGDFVLGMISSLTPEKGHLYAINAFNKLYVNHTNIKLVIVGEGVLKNKLQNKVISLNLNSHIIFAGKRSDIPELFSIFDLFLMPSLQEGLPMALLEAMASGIPVIASKVGEISNVITHNENGFLISPRNTDLLRNILNTILINKDILKAISNNAVNHIRNNYSSIKMTKQYCKLYDKVSHLS